jgi:hypothetical protein
MTPGSTFDQPHVDFVSTLQQHARPMIFFELYSSASESSLRHAGRKGFA